jgi:hypothetical protein
VEVVNKVVVQIQVFQVLHLLVVVQEVLDLLQTADLVDLVAAEQFTVVKVQEQVIVLLYLLLKEITVVLEHIEEALVVAEAAVQLKQEVKAPNLQEVLVICEVAVLVVTVRQTI